MIRFLTAAATSSLLLLALPAAGPGPNTAATSADRTTPQGSVTASSLQTLLDQTNFIEFAREFPKATGLKREQELYFRGTLAYRQGRFSQVIDPLIAAVQTKHTSLTSTQVESAFEILGQTAARTYLYSSSAKMYGDIERLYANRMAEDSAREIREKQHIAALLENVPAETAVIPADFTLQRGASEAQGEIPIRIGGRSYSAQLDTGASVSLLAESTARTWGVTPLEGTATLHGYDGGTFSARPAVIPEIAIGQATIRNVVVFVTPDQNLYIASIKRQTHALLGFPVASALGRLRFSRDGSLTVTAKSPAASQTGAPLWVGDGSLLVALGTEPVFEGNKLTGGTKERLFELDTGSGSTYLTDHYLVENRSRFKGEPASLARLAGVGGVKEIPAYEARKLPLFFGATPVLCSGQHILTQPQGGEAESYYGVVGQDVLRLFSSYTLDFRTMRLSVEP